MTPFEKAENVYQTEECARPFREDLEAHLAGGYVYSTPDFFAMGRPVPSFADPEALVNPWNTWPANECNAWMVYLVAGDMRKAWTSFPYPLEHVIFERDNVLRSCRFESLQRRINRTAQKAAG